MSATPEQLAERLEKYPLYFWSGSSEPEYQISDLPKQAAALIRQLIAEKARLREALEPFAAQTRVSGPTEESNILRARAALRDAP